MQIIFWEHAEDLKLFKYADTISTASADGAFKFF